MLDIIISPPNAGIIIFSLTIRRGYLLYDSKHKIYLKYLVSLSAGKGANQNIKSRSLRLKSPKCLFYPKHRRENNFQKLANNCFRLLPNATPEGRFLKRECGKMIFLDTLLKKNARASFN